MLLSLVLFVLYQLFWRGTTSNEAMHCNGAIQVYNVTVTLFDIGAVWY